MKKNIRIKKIAPTNIGKLLARAPNTVRNGLIYIFKKLAPRNRWGDKLHYDLLFLSQHKRLPGLNQSFNDLLYDIVVSNEILIPERQFSSDKYLSKILATGLIGRDISVPTIAVFTDVEELKSFNLPERCVIKPTFLSGRIIIRKSGEEVDFSEVQKWINLGNSNRNRREANYRYLKPRIIVEPLLFDGEDADDYKIFCINGKAKAILYCQGRNKGLSRAIFSPEWEIQPISLSPRAPDEIPKKPETLDIIISYAEKISSLFSFVRVDFYTDGTSIFLGEISHIHMDCVEKFASRKEEEFFSNLLFD